MQKWVLGVLAVLCFVTQGWAITRDKNQIVFDHNYADADCTESGFQNCGSCDTNANDCACELSCACKHLLPTGQLIIVPGDYYTTQPIDCQTQDHTYVVAEGAAFNCAHDGICLDINKLSADAPNDEGASGINMFQWRGGFFKNTTTSTDDNDKNSVGIRASEVRVFILSEVNVDAFETCVQMPREAVTLRDSRIVHCNNLVNMPDWRDDVLAVSGLTLERNLFGYTEHTTNRAWLSPANDHGIKISARIKHVTIRDNVFDVDSYAGIYIVNDGEGSGVLGCRQPIVRIMGNHFEGGYAESGGTGGYYIYLNDNDLGDSCTYNAPVIESNVFTKENIGAVRIENAVSPWIVNNVFHQSTALGTNHTLLLSTDVYDANLMGNTYVATVPIYPEYNDRTRITFYPENRVVNVTLPSYDLDTFTTLSTVQVDMSTELGATYWPKEAPPKGYWLQVYTKNTAAAGYMRVAKDNTEVGTNDEQHEIPYKVANEEYWESLYVPANVNGDIRVKIEPSGGTVTVTIKIKAIQM